MSMFKPCQNYHHQATPHSCHHATPSLQHRRTIICMVILGHFRKAGPPNYGCNSPVAPWTHSGTQGHTCLTPPVLPSSWPHQVMGHNTPQSSGCKQTNTKTYSSAEPSLPVHTTCSFGHHSLPKLRRHCHVCVPSPS